MGSGSPPGASTIKFGGVIFNLETISLSKKKDMSTDIPLRNFSFFFIGHLSFCLLILKIYLDVFVGTK